MKALLGHISESTAYVVDDYPYGFRLRCKIRYWIEHNETHGFRFCSQTTNPKLSYEHWNKPKKGTYCLNAMGMYLDEESGHVEHCALGIYNDAKEAKEFREKYLFCLNPSAVARLDLWIKMKEIYEEKYQKAYLAQPMVASEPVLLSSLVRK